MVFRASSLLTAGQSQAHGSWREGFGHGSAAVHAPVALSRCLPVALPHRLLATQSPCCFVVLVSIVLCFAGLKLHWKLFSVHSDQKKKKFLKSFLFCPQLPQLIAPHSCLLRDRTETRARRVPSEPQILYHSVKKSSAFVKKTPASFRPAVEAGSLCVLTRWEPAV